MGTYVTYLVSSNTGNSSARVVSVQITWAEGAVGQWLKQCYNMRNASSEVYNIQCVWIGEMAVTMRMGGCPKLKLRCQKSRS